jgi:low temperature requirement protein LtrA
MESDRPVKPFELWWTASLVIEYGTMLVVDTSGWIVSAGHFSERHGLIFIISVRATTA